MFFKEKWLLIFKTWKLKYLQLLLRMLKTIQRGVILRIWSGIFCMFFLNVLTFFIVWGGWIIIFYVHFWIQFFSNDWSHSLTDDCQKLGYSSVITLLKEMPDMIKVHGNPYEPESLLIFPIFDEALDHQRDLIQDSDASKKVGFFGMEF